MKELVLGVRGFFTKVLSDESPYQKLHEIQDQPPVTTLDDLLKIYQEQIKILHKFKLKLNEMESASGLEQDLLNDYKSQTDLAFERQHQIREKILDQNKPTPQTEAATHMTAKHLLALRKHAVANNRPTIYRPINRKAAAKLDDGHEGKNFLSKGKSSEHPLLYGDITFNPFFSKIATERNLNNEDIDNAAKQEKMAIYEEKNYDDINKSTLRFYQIVFAKILDESNLNALKERLQELDSKAKKIPPELFNQNLAAELLKTLALNNEIKKYLTKLENDATPPAKDSLLKIVTKSLDSKKLSLLTQELNDAKLSTKVNKKVEFNGQKYELFYAKDPKDLLPLMHNNEFDQPRLFIKKGLGIYEFNYDRQKFEKCNQDVKQIKQNLYNLEVIAYEKYFKEGKTIATKVKLVTADYDESASESQKIFALENNSVAEIADSLARSSKLKKGEALTGEEELLIEKDKQKLTKLLTKLENGDELQEDDKKYIVSKMADFEIDRWESLANSRKYLVDMGIIDEMRRSETIALRHITDNAKNHSVEATNLNPEPWTNDNHAAILADGNVAILKNEKEVCEFINQQRRNGYPIDINPRWGWEKITAENCNKDKGEIIGDLRIPNRNQFDDYRFNFKEVEGELAKYSKDSNQYKSQKAVFDAYLKLLTAQTAPDVIYTEAAVIDQSPLDAARISGAKDLEEIKARTTEELKLRNAEKIKTLEEEYRNLARQHKTKNNLKPSLVEQEIARCNTQDHLMRQLPRKNSGLNMAKQQHQSSQFDNKLI